MTCRICGGQTGAVLDLGSMPPANRLKESKEERERHYPLVLEKCSACFSLQLRDCVDETDLYSRYVYLTPDSPSLRSHYHFLTEHMFREGYMDATSFVLEIGSNIGRFLKHLKPDVRGVVGVDPAENVCRLAREDGIETECAFFGVSSSDALKDKFGAPDVIVARHCCAHNKNPHDIIEGVASLLADDGCFVMENAYALNTLLNNEFDQIYHEHMFYYTIGSAAKLFELHNMRIVDIAMTPIHGGSIVFFARKGQGTADVRETVEHHRANEAAILDDALLARFVDNAHVTQGRIREVVEDLRGQRKNIWSYGATAKGATLLNYVGLNDAHIEFCADSTPIKHGKFIPMANIEIRPEEEAWRARPDYFLLTAWNYKDEIIEKVRATGNTKSKFIVPIPEVAII